MIIIGVLFFGIPNVQADEQPVNCVCFDDWRNISQNNIESQSEVSISSCQMIASNDCNIGGQANAAAFSHPNGGTYADCEQFPNEVECNNYIVHWNQDKDNKLREIANTTSDLRTREQIGGKTGVLGIPACLFDAVLTPACKNVNTFVYFAINVATFLFGIVGALALVMFVVGGFVYITSAGSPEKIKQGTDIIIAAVIGLIIVFSAYLLVRFLGTAVGLNANMQLLESAPKL